MSPTCTSGLGDEGRTRCAGLIFAVSVINGSLLHNPARSGAYKPALYLCNTFLWKVSRNEWRVRPPLPWGFSQLPGSQQSR